MLNKIFAQIFKRSFIFFNMNINEKLVPLVLYKQSLSTPNSSGKNNFNEFRVNDIDNKFKSGTSFQKTQPKFENKQEAKEKMTSFASSASLKKSNSYYSVNKRFANLSIKPNTKPEINGTRPISTFARFLSTPTSSLTSSNSLEDIVQYIRTKKVKKIVIMAGAGISTNSGIPDFRTPGSGLYDNLKEYKIPFPEAIFDLPYFQVNPRPFYTLAKELYPNGRYRPNIIHYFFRLLHQKGLLLKVYTQNIDGLERLAGLPSEKIMEAHGTFASATCQRCRLKYRGEDVYNVIKTDQLPRCTVRNCQGIIKPDIVFFGEDLPIKFYSYMSDFREADMLFVLGTSLKVEPFAGIVDSMRNGVPRVLFNMKAVGPFKRKCRAHDVVASGDISESVESFADLLSMKEELANLMETEESLYAAKIKDENSAESAKEDQKDSSETQKNQATDKGQHGIKQNTPSPRKGLLTPSKNLANNKPFNKGYSSHAPLVPISELTGRLPSLPVRRNNVSRNDHFKTLPSRNYATRQEFRRPVGRGRGQRKSNTSSSSTSSCSSTSSSSS